MLQTPDKNSDAYKKHLDERRKLIATTGKRIRSGDVEAAEDTAGIGEPPSRKAFKEYEKAKSYVDKMRAKDKGGDIDLDAKEHDHDADDRIFKGKPAIGRRRKNSKRAKLLRDDL